MKSIDELATNLNFTTAKHRRGSLGHVSAGPAARATPLHGDLG